MQRELGRQRGSSASRAAPRHQGALQRAELAIRQAEDHTSISCRMSDSRNINLRRARMVPRKTFTMTNQ
eukprot:6358960-Pyramimonas_sp.AAC.1